MIIPSFFLLCCLSPPVAMMATNSSAEKDNSTGPGIDFAGHYLNSVQHKLDTMINVLTSVDTSIKALHEKAHTWAIFRHHIESWNEQIKSLEQKIDLIKRTQDENSIYETKFSNLEFTLNHILSKVINLGDNSNSQSETFNKNVESLINDRFLEVHRFIVTDKKVRSEIGMRLSNILRHVQFLENDQCRTTNASAGGKSAKLMHCNSVTQRQDASEMIVKAVKDKIAQSIQNYIQKDLKILTAIGKKNIKISDEILNVVKIVNERISELHQVAKQHDSHLMSSCQSITNELTTFTESSDLLLKRIEKVVMNVQSKVDLISAPAERDGDIERNDTVDVNEEEEIIKTVNKTVMEEEDVTEDVVEDIEEPETVTKRSNSNETNEINFFQPTKKSCHELDHQRVDGIYKFSEPKLNEAGRDFNERFCAFVTDGVAWTVIQNRGPYDVQENFNRSWAEYRDGFGQLDKDFWFGNEFIHQLVYDENYELRIEMEDFEGAQVWVEYSIFRLDSEKYNYNLLIGGYRGIVPDAMRYHNEIDFSTYDRRNDRSIDACCACAAGYASGWWFDNCSEVNLNGVFRDSPLGHNYVGIVWEHWLGDYSLKKAKMMIRPKYWINGNSEENSTEYPEDP